MKTKKTTRCLFFLCLFLLKATSSHADDAVGEFSMRLSVGKLPGAIVVVGYKRDAENIHKLLDFAGKEAGRLYDQMNTANPASEVAKLNANHGGKPYPLSSELTSLFKAAERVAHSTSGAFDISQGHFRQIDLDEKHNRVKLKDPTIQVRFDGIIEGFIADVLVRYIYSAGMKNMMIKIGPAFRALGQGVYEPWKLQVEDSLGVYANRAVNVFMGNSGAAAVSGNAQSCCRGVTIAMKEAALAQGTAQAIFVLGIEEGKKLLEQIGGAKWVIVDQKGNFIRSPGF